jgi:hypothetical protein
VLEDAQIADPTKKMATVVRRTIFLPKISENLANTGVDAALARRYADPIQVYTVAECNSLMMVGITVVAIVKSKAARNNESYEYCLKLVRTSRLWRFKGCTNEKSKQCRYQLNSNSNRK